MEMGTTAFGKRKNWEIVNPVLSMESGAEKAFSGDFSNRAGNHVSLYVVCTSTAFLANENFFHNAKVYLPSAK